MYLERIENYSKITEEIGNLLIEDSIVNLLIKGILNVSTIIKRDTLNLNVELNQRVKIRTEQIIGIFSFSKLTNLKIK